MGKTRIPNEELDDYSIHLQNTVEIQSYFGEVNDLMLQLLCQGLHQSLLSRHALGHLPLRRLQYLDFSPQLGIRTQQLSTLIRHRLSLL